MRVLGRNPLLVVCLLGCLAACGRQDRPLTSSAPGCDVSPDSLDFGEVLLQHQVQKEITLTNPGSQDLDLRVSGPEEPFEVVFLDTTLTLRPGQSKTATVTFSPQTTGPHTSMIRLGSDLCTDIFCTGVGTLFDCEVAPTAIDFGYVRTGDVATRSFVLRNPGTEPLEGTLQAGCGDFEIDRGGAYSLVGGDSLVVNVTFAPRSPGTTTCTVTNTGRYCDSVALTGKGFRGKTWLVRPDGAGDAPTIQAAIDSSADWDTVLVAAGRYLENIDFLDKDIVVMSQQGPEATIIDGSSKADAVVTIGSQTTRSAVLEGFTITGGSGSTRFGPNPLGGGIFIHGGSPTIRANIITGNRAATAGSSFGGGLSSGFPGFASSFSASPLIEGNLITDNESFGGGGGVSLTTGSPILLNNVIRNNRSHYDGGGAFINGNLDHVVVEGNRFIENIGGDHGGGIASWNSTLLGGEGRVDVISNLFLRNVALGLDSEGGVGGGIHIWGVRGSVVNNTFVGNVCSNACEGGGVAAYEATSEWEIERNIIAFNSPEGLVCGASDPTIIRDNLFYGNADQDIGCAVQRCPVDSSNVIADPLFCDPASDDYTLRADSPALAGPEPIGYATTPGCN